jgi:hypothetical protein
VEHVIQDILKIQNNSVNQQQQQSNKHAQTAVIMVLQQMEHMDVKIAHKVVVNVNSASKKILSNVLLVFQDLIWLGNNAKKIVHLVNMQRKMQMVMPFAHNVLKLVALIVYMTSQKILNNVENVPLEILKRREVVNPSLAV